MRTWEERHEEAARHVAAGQAVICRMHALIDHWRSRGRATTELDETLALFQKCQDLFKDDLERIQHERH